ncbi:hypothetical protein ES703_95203 [subsurface metagenome]
MDSLSHLKLVLNKDRAPTQKAVLKSLIRGNETYRRIAEDTGLSITQVKSALAQLKRYGSIQRVKRGTYKPNVPLICLVLRDRLKKLENVWR